ncbi:MAG: phosphate acyltransferase PlsX [Clostridium sp.]|jgi:glycerol-3-phosphate acyltransferase PlsX|nr:phosphate acyltransferase PlsX [Clostridium sp.]
MNIIVDAFGGDKAPLSVLRGCAAAYADYGIKTSLAGDEKQILACADENNISLDGCRLLAAGERDGMEAGLAALAAGGGAFVSAGETGKLVLLADKHIGRLAGIKRAAIAAVLPSLGSPFILIDSGANLNCVPQTLEQFALMGAEYSRAVFGTQKPRVAMLNIGAEASKGDSLHREAFALLSKESVSYEFIGNAEARELPFGVCDVVVADGFSGNVFLKSYEGTAAALFLSLKQVFRATPAAMLSSLLIKKQMLALKNKLDYKQYGGAPLLGFTKTVIKAHGASDSVAICNAVRQAELCVRQGLAETLAEKLSDISVL